MLSTEYSNCMVGNYLPYQRGGYKLLYESIITKSITITERPQWVSLRPQLFYLAHLLINYDLNL